MGDIKAALSIPSTGTVAPEHHEVVIVGGGIGGLYTAKKLISAGVKDVVVLEGRGSVGGRVKTTKNKEGEVLYNDFAWRVGETNTMMHALAKELGLELREQTTPPSADPKGHGQCKHGLMSSFIHKHRKHKQKNHKEIPQPEIKPNRPPLSEFAKHALVSTAEADQQDRESGYAGRTAQIAWPDESHGSKAWVVEKGMNAFATELMKRLPEGTVLLHHLAVDVTKTSADGQESQYRIDVMTQKGKEMESKAFTCKYVVLAAPPFSLRKLSVAKHMQPALFAVHERRLGHCYVKVSSDVKDVPDRSDRPDRFYRMIPDSILQQLISGDYGHGIFQAAYACDRFERVWRELQYQGPDTMMQQVKAQLEKLSESDKSIKPEWWEKIEEVHLTIGFVHRWHIEAHVNGKTKEELSMQALTPNPQLLPNLFLSGEAFSPQQGWTEGALWTGDKVANMITKMQEGKADAAGRSPFAEVVNLSVSGEGKIVAPEKEKVMVYHGLVVDTSTWGERHPGGMGPIAYFSGSQSSNIIDMHHAGNPAVMATLFGLQMGTTP
eukprot:m.344245 g.344245  ORF g.344245 m.344245 type:complete len:550 (-) comp24064_c0_seq1:77-1726(-)